MKTKRLLSIVAIIFLGVVLTSVVLGAADAKEMPFSRTNAVLQPDDFGDAPDPTYPTLMASNGARHTFDDITFLGNPPDLEPDGQPDAFATGDDLDGNDDEDGVLFTSPLLIGQVAAVDVEASVEGLLNAWLDFNTDGDWTDGGEQIFTDQPLVAGINSLTFGVPPDAVPGISFSRWRFSTERGLSFEGPALSGEVEDHAVEILGAGPAGQWEKWINGVPWKPEFGFTVETSDTIEVRDTVQTDPAAPFVLVENWNPLELLFLDYVTEPPGIGQVVLDDGVLIWQVPGDHPEIITLIKQFHVEPCTWEVTILEEMLEGLDVPEPVRPVRFEKVPPILGIDALYEPEVLAGAPAQFTLVYSNTGGYENDVMIRNDFPPEAAFLSSVPPPDRWDEEAGLWAEWDVGDLAQGTGDNIDVTVAIDPGLPLSTTVQIWDYILNHVREEADAVEITLHVRDTAGEPLFDLGDAPDSTNHAGTAMTAYPAGGPPGIQADYPTVFDPATGLPQGPLHRQPLADAWLGPWVTLEFDADLLPDQDGVTNIDPPPDLPDLDMADDGIKLPVGLPDCTRTIISYTVTVAPGALDLPRFVNVWFDWIRDGDWNDILTCFSDGDAPEWAVQNQVLPPLPPGTYVLQTPAFLPFNKAPEAPVWMRISIAEQPAPIPPDGSLPDGSGPPNGYAHGETEDYYLPGVIPVPAEWTKWINGLPWTPEIQFTVETSDTVEIVDVITAPPDAHFALYENWVPEELRLTDYVEEPSGFGRVIRDDGILIWEVLPGHPEVITLTKRFHVEPSTWTSTVLEETLEGLDVPEPVRPVVFEKKTPELWIDAEYDPRVFTGQPANFTLVYSNTGGAENDIMIRNLFPDEAPYVSSVPPAARQDPNGSWAEWDVPFLPGDGRDIIDVVVDIAPGLLPSTTVVITDYIFNHVGELQDEVVIQYHVEPPPGDWEKLINGVTWRPGITFTVETSDTIEIVDVVKTDRVAPFKLAEDWDPTRLRLRDWAVQPMGFSDVISEQGTLIWDVFPGHPEVITLTKWFHVEPSTWTETTLREVLEGLDVRDPIRSVVFEKKSPELWIDAEYDSAVFAGQPGKFTLVYSNTGGAENDILIRNLFPDEAPYASSTPPADRWDPNGSWAEWDVPFLPGGGLDSIDVAVDIEPGLLPSTTVVITDYIFNHAGDMADEVAIRFHIEPPPWQKWVNGVSWRPGITFTIETSKTIEVVDVVRADPTAPFRLTEKWDATELRLRDYTVEPGNLSEVLTDDGTLIWNALPGHPEVITLTKWFHVEPCTWTETTLLETLEGVNDPEPIRPVIFEKVPPDLKLDAVYESEVLAGNVATFTLVYSNTGGAENDVGIRNDFPPEALFLDSDPGPVWQAPDGSAVRWDVGYLGMGDAGQIDVTVAINPSVPVSTQITIVDYIYNHVGEEVDRTTITYHVDEPPTQSADRDIYIKDNPLDDGSVPSTPPWWISPDMWVRTDGNCANTVHQNPVAGTTNTICVRVRNRMASMVSNVTVNLYWGSAALGLYWPGSYSFAGSAHIASLPGGTETVVAVPWATPNITGHFCLLARADSPDDPIGSGFDTTVPQDQVPNNNNISMKNVNIVAYPELGCSSFTSTPGTDKVYLDVVNPTGHGATVDVVFDSADFPLGSGEMVVEPGALWGRWSTLTRFNQVGNTLLPIGFPATMGGISMTPYETVRISVTIKAPLDERFALHVSEQVDDELVGGIDYLRMLPHCTFTPIILKNYSTPTSALASPGPQISSLPLRQAQIGRPQQLR